MSKKILFFLCVLCCSFVFAQENANMCMSGIKNAKDLGGIRIGDKVVSKNRILRSSNLSKATDADLRLLEDSFKVAMIIDLRTTMELMVEQDQQPNNCLYINLPCLESAVSSRTSFIKDTQDFSSDDDYVVADLFLDSIENRKVRQLATVLYPMIIRNRTVQEQYGEVIDSLCSLPTGKSALIHCTNGKDRTGWCITFILAALGANRETLVKEFMSSEAYCQPYLDYILPKAKERGCSEQQLSYLQALVGVGRKEFEDALDMIDQRYGSMHDYIVKSLGCDDAKMTRLRELFLEDLK